MINFCRYSWTASACGSVKSSSRINLNICAESVRVRSCETVSGLEIACSAVRLSDDEAHGLLLGFAVLVARSEVVFEENVTFLLMIGFAVCVW